MPVLDVIYVQPLIRKTENFVKGYLSYFVQALPHGYYEVRNVQYVDGTATIFLCLPLP
ncbi:hypothetical protein D3C80_2058470 [compost metagenome]